MNELWYQKAVDLMLSRTRWDVYQLAKKLSKLLDKKDAFNPDFNQWYTTLYIAGDRGAKHPKTKRKTKSKTKSKALANNFLQTQHIVESLLDPDFRPDILENHPEKAVFPNREKLKNAILKSDFLEYVPEIKSLATLHYYDRSGVDAETLFEQLTFQQRKNKILDENKSKVKNCKRLNVVFDLQSEYGKETESWTEQEWFDRCFEAANALFLDSKSRRLGTDGFHSFWLIANPLRKRLFCLIQPTSTENSTSP